MTITPNRARPPRRKLRRRPRRPRLHPSNWMLYPATRPVPICIVLAGVLTFAAVLGDTAAAAADAEAPVPLAVDSIQAVVNNIRLWLLGILASYATLCLTVAFFRYTSGDAGEVEKARVGFRSAAIGYAGALLAPLVVTIIGQWVA